MNNNIDISNESLQNAVKNWCIKENWYHAYSFNKNFADELFLFAVNWQKEKDKAIIDKLSEALAKLVNWHSVHDAISFIDQQDLEQAKQLLNQLNETK